MRLDPEFEPLRQMPPPDFNNIKAARARMVSMQALIPLRQSSSVKFDDRAIPGPAGDLQVRVYTPDDGGKKGALLYFHGGGWVVGDLDTEHSQCIDHAEKARCVVISLDYRLAPEFPFPAAHEDAWAALRWVVENASKLGVDPERIAVGGGSSGATLAAGIALRARDEGSPKLKLALLLQPSVDHLQTSSSARTFSDTPFLSSKYLPQIWATYFAGNVPTGRMLSYAAPAAADRLAGFPPTCLIIGDADPLRDEGLQFGSRLIADGVEVDMHLCAGAPHGFDLVEHAQVTELMRDVRAAALIRALSPDSQFKRRMVAANSAMRMGGPLILGLVKKLVTFGASAKR